MGGGSCTVTRAFCELDGKALHYYVTCHSFLLILQLHSSTILEGSQRKVESISVFLDDIGDVLALFHGFLETNKKKY